MGKDEIRWDGMLPTGKRKPAVQEVCSCDRTRGNYLRWHQGRFRVDIKGKKVSSLRELLRPGPDWAGQVGGVLMPGGVSKQCWCAAEGHGSVATWQGWVKGLFQLKRR